jgi:hypothetical protein
MQVKRADEDKSGEIRKKKQRDSKERTDMTTEW